MGTMNKIDAWIRDRFMAMRPKVYDYVLPLIRHYEGYEPNWYRCSSNVLTIGYGHTGSIKGLRPPPWDEPYAAWVLETHDLKNAYEPWTVEVCAKVGIDFYKEPVARQAVYESLCFNGGAKPILNGTWIKLLLQGRPRAEVEQAFYRWNKAGSDGNLKTSPGLVRRRFTEMILFYEGKLDFDPDGWKDYYEQHR